MCETWEKKYAANRSGTARLYPTVQNFRTKMESCESKWGKYNSTTVSMTEIKFMGNTVLMQNRHNPPIPAKEEHSHKHSLIALLDAKNT